MCGMQLLTQLPPITSEPVALKLSQLLAFLGGNPVPDRHFSANLETELWYAADVYSHIAPSMHAEAAELVARLVSGE